MFQQEDTRRQSPLGIVAAFLRRIGVIGSALACACVSIPVAGMIAVCADKLWPSHRSDLDSLSAAQLTLLVVFAGPILETLFFQLLVGAAAKAFSSNMAVRMVMICIPFALSHFPLGVSAGLSAGVVGGVVFGFLFIAWQDVSVSKAVLATFLAHSLHNAAVLAVDRFS